MKKYVAPAVFALIAVLTACGDAENSQDKKDTVVIEKNTVIKQEPATKTTIVKPEDPGTTVNVGPNGIVVKDGKTGVVLSKDSMNVQFKKKKQ